MAPRNRRLLQQLGITRVARVTGLDRTGVEVACAVRPLGHVLQVCNGKGATWEDASASAVSEAAELWAAERVNVAMLRLGTAEELRACVGAERVWGPSRFGSDDRLGRCSWLELEGLDGKGTVWVPAALVHCPARGTPLFGLPGLSWTSNGAAAHPEEASALRHALLEVIERDQLSRSLPQGWTQAAMRARQVEAPRGEVAALVKQIEARGFRCLLADLTPNDHLGVPVGGALLLDLERGPVPLTAGYAAAATPERALSSALREAAQSRLTDIHGAREDVESMPAEEVEAMAQWIARSKPKRTVARMPRLSKREATGAALVRRLMDRGIPSAVARWSSPDGQLEIVKVVCPGLQRSELL